MERNKITINNLKSDTMTLEHFRESIMIPFFAFDDIHTVERSINIKAPIQDKVKKTYFINSIPTLSRIFSGEQKNKYYKKVLEKIATNSKDPESGEKYNFENNPHLKILKKVWRNYLDDNKLQKSSLEKNTILLCNQSYDIKFTHEGITYDLDAKLKSLLNKDLESRLSVLFIIASTWPYWEEAATKSLSKETLFIHSCLCEIMTSIFPSSSTETKKIKDTSPEDRKKLDNISLLYNNAISLFSKDLYSEAFRLFEKILNEYSSIAPISLLADVCDYLVKCNNYDGINCKISKKFGFIDDLKNLSIHYGSTNVKTPLHTIKAKAVRAQSSNRGICIVNCKNSRSDWIEKTLPESPSKWELIYPDDGPVSEFTLDQNIRFVLIDDTLEKNIKDTLNILNKLKETIDKNDLDFKFKNQIELVIRCKEEDVTLILDTACSLLDEKSDVENPIFSENPIRIYFIDEEKRSADYLYAKHPLFYPYTLPGNKDKIDKKPLNLVLLSDNDNLDYISWLIREAFWMLPHRSSNIKSKILVLSPYADEISSQVTALCPGFAGFSTSCDPSSDLEKGVLKNDLIDKNPINISDIAFPEIKYIKLPFDKRAFSKRLESFGESDEFFYFIVDSSSDINAISIATKIREVQSRKAVLSKRTKIYSPEETVIAVRCSDPDYAELLENFIVPKENENENMWFNKYRLISFGSVKDLYSWDELTGGNIEFMSVCLHLQYCSGATGHNFNEAPEGKDLWSYYRRLYNRDSSFSQAMSLPYRLFEAGIVPRTWFIENEDTFWNEHNRKELAERFKRILNEEIIDKLARYEHTRWCCYMLSRGWLPATSNNVHFYMSHGVQKHVLQIAKLHPCLCSWDNLQILYNELHDFYEYKKDDFGKPVHNKIFERYKDSDKKYFQKLDLKNIEQTADMLKAKPIKEKVSIEEYER